MQKVSHALLARTLLEGQNGFQKKRFELAFLFGSFQPDCNPLSYLKGSLRGRKFGGHNFSNSERYIDSRIARLSRRATWRMWQYYTLGKLTHYLADAFTFPHNETFRENMAAHCRYEFILRSRFSEYLKDCAPERGQARADLAGAIRELHRQYLANGSNWQRDSSYILRATEMLMDSLLPRPAASFA